MIREHYVAVLPANYVNVFYMELCVSGGSYVKYTYNIGPRAQPRGPPRSYKYFFFIRVVAFPFIPMDHKKKKKNKFHVPIPHQYYSLF